MPFKALDPKSSLPVASPDGHSPAGNQKKRRLSEKDSFHRASKSPRADIEQENKAVVDNIYRSNRKSQLKGPNTPKITDDEISSSCKSDVKFDCEVNSSGRKLTKCVNLLERFVQKGHQQVPEVSTSSDLVGETVHSKKSEGSGLTNSGAIETSDANVGCNISIKDGDVEQIPVVNSICNDDISDTSKSKTEASLSSTDGEKSEQLIDGVVDSGEVEPNVSIASLDDKDTSLDATATSIDLDSSVVDDRSSESVPVAQTPSRSPHTGVSIMVYIFCTIAGLAIHKLAPDGTGKTYNLSFRCFVRLLCF